MKITIHPKQIPSNWDDFKFGHFLAFYEAKDFADQLAIFTGLKAETLRKSKIDGLESLIERMAFMNKLMPSILPKSILGYPLPKDMNFESVCQYEDLKDISSKLPQDGKTATKEQIALYADMVTVYAMPDYIDSTQEQRNEWAKQVLNAPCWEVMAVGNFTLLKLLELRAKELGIYPKAAIRMRKFRLVLNALRARLGFLVRSFSWKKKHHIAGTNY